VTASDYEFTTLVDEGASPPYTRKTLRFLFPGSSFSGTYDLTSSTGYLYRYTVGQCSVSRYDARIGGPNDDCRLEAITYSPMRITVAGSAPSCTFGDYTYLCQNNQPAGQATNPYVTETLSCGKAFAAKDMASTFSIGTAWTSIGTISEARDAYVNDGTTSLLYSGGSVVLFGTYGGLSRFPVGTPTETGDSTLTVTDATFV
jgi:hypothetical protein